MLLLLPLAIPWLLPARAMAQPIVGGADEPQYATVHFLGANALLGGLTGAVGQWLGGGSFADGFTVGVAGGVVAYAGRRVVVSEFDGAGLLGRQIGAVGGSMVANAAAGRGPISRIELPLGPMILRFEPAQTLVPQPRLLLYDAIWLASGLLESRLELDAWESLSSGAPVLRAPRHDFDTGAAGHYIGGLIVLPRRSAATTLPHERVHVLQFDYFRQLWGDPLEDWALDKLPWAVPGLHLVQPGVGVTVLWSALRLRSVWEAEDRPWEIEANFLEDR